MALLQLLNTWEFEDLHETLIDAGIDSLQKLREINFENLEATVSKTLRSREVKYLKEKWTAWREEVQENQPTSPCTAEKSIENQSESIEGCSQDSTNLQNTPRRSPRIANETQVTTSSADSAKKQLFPVLIGQTSSSQDLQKKLEASTQGCQILAYFKKYNTLDNKRRNKLCNFIISDALTPDPNKKLTADTLKRLQDDIVRTFPNENPLEWYTPYMTDEDGKSINATGRLVFGYHNHRRELIKSGLATPFRNSKRTASTIEGVFISDEQVLKNLQILKDPEVLSEQALTLWSDTFHARLDDFEKKYSSIEEYLNTYPILKSPIGAKLFRLDFKEKFPNYEISLLNAWNEVKEKVLNFVKDVLKEDLNLLQILQHDDVDLEVADSKLLTVAAFRLIGYYSSVCKAIKGSNGKIWHPDKKDAMNSVLLLVKSSANITLSIDEEIEKAAKFGLTLQPLPIAVVNEKEVVSSHFFINGKLHFCESPLDAIDLAFKTYQVLNATYPSAGKMPWLFIQRFIYKINTRYDGKCLTPLNFARKIKLVA